MSITNLLLYLFQLLDKGYTHTHISSTIKLVYFTLVYRRSKGKLLVVDIQIVVLQGSTFFSSFFFFELIYTHDVVI